MGNPTDDIAQSFAAVNTFVSDKHPELSSVEMLLCSKAEEEHKESILNQAEENKPPRVYAHVGHQKDTICVAKQISELSDSQIQGIFVHEFGHIWASIHPETEDPTNPLDWEDDGDADWVVTNVFGVNLHYDENEIEYVELPIGSEALDKRELSDEELEEALAEIDPELEEALAEEASEYDLGLSDSNDLKASLELIPEEVDDNEARAINDDIENGNLDNGTDEVIDLVPEE